MSFIAAKWTIDDYHRMIAAGILCDRRVELVTYSYTDCKQCSVGFSATPGIPSDIN